jgi:hypothetical protein
MSSNPPVPPKKAKQEGQKIMEHLYSNEGKGYLSKISHPGDSLQERVK